MRKKKIESGLHNASTFGFSALFIVFFFASLDNLCCHFFLLSHFIIIRFHVLRFMHPPPKKCNFIQRIFIIFHLKRGNRPRRPLFFLSRFIFFCEFLVWIGVVFVVVVVAECVPAIWFNVVVRHGNIVKRLAKFIQIDNCWKLHIHAEHNCNFSNSQYEATIPCPHIFSHHMCERKFYGSRSALAKKKRRENCAWTKKEHSNTFEKKTHSEKMKKKKKKKNEQEWNKENSQPSIAK